MTDRISQLADFISRSNPTFDDLSPEDQIIAKTLVQTNKEFLIKDLPLLLYDRIPPTVEEFLSTDMLGMTAETLFPVWRRALADQIFAPHSKVKEVIFTGATGTGKSRTADLCNLYNITRVLCFKQPQIMFGVAPATTLANILISVDLKKAWMAMLKPFVETLRASHIFEEVRRESDFMDYEPFNQKFPFYVDNIRNIVYFPKNITLFSGSQETHTISMSLMGATLDEIEFRRSANSVQAGMSLYLTIKERLENRFLDIPWTMLCLVSSAKSSEGVIPTYIEKIPKDSPLTKVFSYAVWEVRDFDVYRQGYFYVLKGNKIVPSRVLSSEECKAVEAGKFNAPVNSKIIKVPEAHRQTFETNVSRALRNTAGEIDIDEIYIFDEYETLEKFNPDLSPELHLTADVDAGQLLIQQIPTHNFIVYNGSNKFLKRAPKAKHYCHLDLAEITEAGVTLCHKELGDHNTLLYVIDFACIVTSPSRIDLEAIARFLEDLDAEYNVRFGKITADQYQSAFLLQRFKKSKLAETVEHLSVDRTLDAYHRVAANIENIRIGHCPVLLEQAKCVKEVNNKLTSRVRKDLLDSLVGSVFNAICDVRSEPEYSYAHESSKPVVKPEPPSKKLEEL